MTANALTLINILAIGVFGVLLWSLRKTILQERNQRMAAINNLRANITELQGTANDTVAEVKRLQEGNEQPIQDAADQVKVINDQLRTVITPAPET